MQLGIEYAICDCAEENCMIELNMTLVNADYIAKINQQVQNSSLRRKTKFGENFGAISALGGK